MNSTESIPQVWDDERDDQFFRITASLFTPSYCYGASVLLASYDVEDAFTADTASQTAITPSAATTESTAGHYTRPQHTAR